jgi:hypothetical protein
LAFKDQSLFFSLGIIPAVRILWACFYRWKNNEGIIPLHGQGYILAGPGTSNNYFLQA